MVLRTVEPDDASEPGVITDLGDDVGFTDGGALGEDGQDERGIRLVTVKRWNLEFGPDRRNDCGTGKN